MAQRSAIGAIGAHSALISPGGCSALSVGIMEWEPDVPRWRQVYALLERRIYDGVYAPGARLPSALQLVEETGVSPVTARRVLRELRDAGLAYMEPGIGTFVARLPEKPTP